MDATYSKICHVEKEMTTMLEITYSKEHKTAKRHSPFVIVMKEADSSSHTIGLFAQSLYSPLHKIISI